jgi:cytochrome c oxidase subunit II
MANGSGTGRITAPGLVLGGLLLVLILVSLWLFMSDRFWFTPVASEHGAAVDFVFTSVLIVTGIAFVIVQGLLAWFVTRYGENGERASYWHDNPKAEAILIGMTALTLTVLVFMGQKVWADIYFRDQPEDALLVEITGQQFHWVIRYPGPDGELGGTFDPELINNTNNFIGLDRNDPAGADDIMVDGLLHLVRDRPVRAIIRSTDVIHSFHIPNMRVKQDAVPGLAVEIWFTPTVAGQYEIACAELCGLNHFAMRGFLTVDEDQAGLDAFLQEQLAFQ